MTLLLALLFVVLAGLVTLPLARSAGVGRIAAFAVLSIVGAAGALLLAHSDLVPDWGGDSSEVAGTDAEVETVADMEAALEKALGLKVVRAPSVEALRSDHAAVWRFERDHLLLCAPQDFPDSSALECFVPYGTIGGEPAAFEDQAAE